MFPQTSISLDVLDLDGDNNKVWKDRILLQSGCMDIDYAIRKDKLVLFEPSTPTQVALHERWERSNHLSLMFIKTRICAGIRGSIKQYTNVKDLLKAINEQFVTSDKALANILIMKFSSLRLTNLKGVREHIMNMRDIAAQLKKLEVDMSKSFLVYYILNTLSKQYGPFKISYNTHKDKWFINELMIICVLEEGRLLMEQGDNAFLMNQGKSKEQAKNKGKGKVPAQADIKKESKYFFCKKKGHIKKDCAKFQQWLKKKGNLISCVYYESNIAEVSHSTWWIDSVLQFTFGTPCRV